MDPTQSLTDCPELSLILAQCRISTTIDLLIIDCPRKLWRSLDIERLMPCRLEVLHVEFYCEGGLRFEAGIEFWVGYKVA